MVGQVFMHVLAHTLVHAASGRAAVERALIGAVIPRDPWLLWGPQPTAPSPACALARAPRHCRCSRSAAVVL